MHGLLVCLVDKTEYPFIILRETKCGDIIFCLENEIIKDDGYYSTPKNFYHVIQDGEQNSIRGKIVSKRCYFTEEAVNALESEYGIKVNPRRSEYSLIKPYLRYKEVEVTYRF